MSEGQPVSLVARRGGDVTATARVALLRPPVVVFPRSLSSYGPVPPIGLAYIAAVLREAGHHVDVVDGAGEGIDRAEDVETPVGTLRRVGLPPEEIVERIPGIPDMVGITHMFLHEWPQVRELATLVRARFPDAVIVLGGENATAFKDHIFEQCPAVDGCVLGEGEATAVELANRLVEGRPLAGVPGVALREPDGDGTVDTGLSPRMRRLGEVPRPAWDLFPVERYLAHGDYFGVNRGPAMPILATRGCPYKCSFCSSPQMWTTRYVVRDPDDVADEIAGYVERYGVRNINFCDLTAATKRTWTLSLCDALERRGVRVDWQLSSGTRAEALDAEVLQRLYDTGCRYVTFAPESGSERMLEVFDKRVKLPVVLRSLEAAHRIGIRTRVNVIIGHPEERWRDLLRSLRLLVRAARVGTDDAAVIMFSPYPGSRDYDALVDSGQLVVDEASYYVGIARAAGGGRTYNPRMRPWQLKAAQLVMLLTFYGLGLVLHPVRAWEYVRAQRTGRENTFLDQLVRIKRTAFRPEAAPDRARRPAVPPAG